MLITPRTTFFIRKAVIFMHNNNDAVRPKRTASFLDIGVRGVRQEPLFFNNLFLPFTGWFYKLALLDFELIFEVKMQDREGV